MTNSGVGAPPATAARGQRHRVNAFPGVKIQANDRALFLEPG
jgi:hypothetical protein